MERNLIGCCGLLVAISFAGQAAEAGDRKSASRTQESKMEILGPRKAHPTVLQYETIGASAARPFEARSSASAADRSSRDRRSRHEATRPEERKELTFFHINSKFGEVAVQPVLGRVNGAQFSLGF